MNSENFSKAHEFTARWEGGFSDHPADRGGFTVYGASIKFVQGIADTATGRNFLQAIGVQLPVTKAVMRNLSRAQVAAMFRHEFWDALHLDDLPFRHAALLYDAAVNTGRPQAVKFSQRGYNRCVLHGVKLAVDGIIGPLTRKALQTTDTDKVVLAILNARRDFYENRAESRPDQRVFLNGWLNRCNGLERMLLG